MFQSRRAIVPLLLLTLAAALHGCGGGEEKATFVSLRIERGMAGTGVTRIKITATLNGMSAMRTVEEMPLAEISLPTTLTYQIGTASGPLTLEATAENQMGKVIGRGSVTVTVVRDTTVDGVIILAGLPGAPANVVATPLDASAQVTWSAPGDGGSPITGYKIVATPGNVMASATGTSVTIAGLTNGTPVTFTVVATNLVGDGPPSMPSNEVTPLKCGDGSMGGSEECDDGNTDDTDACTNSCKNAKCGDGIQRAGVEMCDDGNMADNDACTNACVPAKCGDSITWNTAGGTETCDDGNMSNTDACTTLCLIARCGDGFTQTGVDQCDDGNSSNTDTCTTSCMTARCGDGFTQPGETCDDGNGSNNDACPTGAGGTCRTSTCGDGFVWNTAGGLETCDDANASNSDACPSGAGGTCKNAICGDGFVRTTAPAEPCDDGNMIDTDSCSNSCMPGVFAVTIAPVAVSPVGSTCETRTSNWARKIGIDQGNNVYAAMKCGTSIHVAASRNGGLSFSTVMVPFSPVPDEYAVEGGPAGVVYGLAMAGSTAAFSRSIDSGTNFSTPIIVEPSALTPGFSIASSGDTVFLGIKNNTGPAVYRNTSRGAGSFLPPVQIPIQAVFWDIMIDRTTGFLWAGSDTAPHHLSRSTNGGQSFEPDLMPPGATGCSDWSVGNGFVFTASGCGDPNYKWFDTSKPPATMETEGVIPQGGGDARAVTVDGTGTAYVVQQNATTQAIELYRIPRGQLMPDATVRTLSSNGEFPHVTALPNNRGVAVSYFDRVSSRVVVTIQVY